MRIFMTLVLALMMTGAATTQPSPSARQDPAVQKLEQMRAQLDKLFAQLFSDVEQLRKDYQELRDDVNVIKDKMGVVKTEAPQEMPILKPSEKRTLDEPENKKEVKKTRTEPTGFLAIQNNWEQPVSIVVKDNSQTQKVNVAPGESKNVSLAAGDFSYTIIGIQNEVKRRINPGDIFRVTVRAESK